MKQTILPFFMAFFLFTLTAEASFPVKKNKSGTIVVNSVDTVDKASTTVVAAASSGKSQTTAIILAVLIGGLGIHRFYLGYTWQGVVQLLTFGGLGIWALIDMIRIITGDFQPKNGSYSKTL